MRWRAHPGRAMVRSVVVLTSLSGGGCHLAPDDTVPLVCAAGSHADNGRCVPDMLDGPIITISAGATCAPAPASITVAPKGSFSFTNDDGADHVVTGADGTVWVTVLANQVSSYVGITKTGTFKYSLSGCPTGGVVVVQ